jgi:hypothetical protein
MQALLKLVRSSTPDDHRSTAPPLTRPAGSAGPKSGTSTDASQESTAFDAVEAAIERYARASTPRARVYARWMVMLGKDPRRCGMGPQRARAIEQWIGVYGVDTLELAIDGAAGDAWVSDRPACSSIEWILGNEGRIERFAEQGERARAAIERQRRRRQAGEGADARAADAAATASDDEGEPIAPERFAEVRTKLMELRAALLVRRPGGAA